MDTFDVLKEIVVEKFEKESSMVTLDATLETLEIDSLDTFDIIFDLEDKFDIKVPNEELDISTLGDVVVLIDRIRAEQK